MEYWFWEVFYGVGIVIVTLIGLSSVLRFFDFIGYTNFVAKNERVKKEKGKTE